MRLRAHDPTVDRLLEPLRAELNCAARRRHLADFPAQATPSEPGRGRRPVADDAYLLDLGVPETWLPVALTRARDETRITWDREPSPFLALLIRETGG